MNRFTRLFATLKSKNEGAFVPFVTLCDPDFDTSFAIIDTLIKNGADALELGLPFSDPLLDGTVIQAANQRALDAGYSTDACFALLAKVRKAHPDIAISLLLCANLVFAAGVEAFYRRCQESGVDAVLIADLPVEFAHEFAPIAKQYGIAPVFICPPNADDALIQSVATQSAGYTYLVSRAGVTSAQNQHSADNLDTLVHALKKHNAPPILQGFGIATPAQVKQALWLGADGAISGSAVVGIIAAHLADTPTLLDTLGHFVAQMKTATKAPL